MKQSYVSWLGLFIVMPAFAGARLPAVNMSAAAVSARAQYGVPTETQKAQNKTVAKQSEVAGTRRVVARSTTRPVEKKTVADEPKVAVTDYLRPKRPTSNLWGNDDAPLRMPRAEEFSVIASNDLLPEEHIGATSTRATSVIDSRAAEIAELSQRASSLDSQIAHLMELQRAAEAAANAPVASTQKIESFAVNSASVEKNSESGDVRIARMTVPRDELIGSEVVTRAVKAPRAEKITPVRDDMTRLSPAELRRAFRRTFLSENKHLSTYPADDRFDVASNIDSSIEGFTSSRDLSENASEIRKLEIKIRFRNSDSALSRENYNLLSEYAGVVVRNPKRAIQVTIPASATTTTAGRKLAARRLAIVEQVLRDTGVSEQRIVPVLSDRSDDGMVLRIISNDQFETLTQKKRDMFGDTVNSKTTRSMSW